MPENAAFLIAVKVAYAVPFGFSDFIALRNHVHIPL
jgi:hypothetical protein